MNRGKNARHTEERRRLTFRQKITKGWAISYRILCPQVSHATRHNSQILVGLEWTAKFGKCFTLEVLGRICEDFICRLQPKRLTCEIIVSLLGEIRKNRIICYSKHFSTICQDKLKLVYFTGCIICMEECTAVMSGTVYKLVSLLLVLQDLGELSIAKSPVS